MRKKFITIAFDVFVSILTLLLIVTLIIQILNIK